MKLSFFTLVIVISSITAAPSADAQPNQAADLVTEAATITSKWNLVGGSNDHQDSSLRVSDPECKKINPLEYLNNPESFFQPCYGTDDTNRQNYEPIEYLKVPKLDSGLSVTVTNF
ncbi:MAG: hypothetical protein EAZ77_18640 [Nostocales cyanobacterium]|nr:MAG: hypothetical protein EAZ77_18640 [Nostocales cyanobacterium]